MASKKFKMGDVREDGMVFWAYRHGRKNDQYWMTREKFDARRSKVNAGWNSHYPRRRRSKMNERLMRKFGITIEQYEKMSVEQKHVCAICEKPETAVFMGSVKNMAVDHCHETGEVRSLLCTRCNTLIGMARDNPDILYSAIDYLVAHRDRIERKHGT